MLVKKVLKKLQFTRRMSILSLSGFTFKHPTNNDTYNVKLKEKMSLLEQTFKWDKLGFELL